MRARGQNRTRGLRIPALFTMGLLTGLTACGKPDSNSTVAIQAPVQHFRLSNITGSTDSLQFDLTDSASGKQVNADTYHGKFVLVYFGYTHCPDVCPTTVARMAQSLNQLGERLAKKVQVLFVTVDPARDSATIMAAYAHNFGPHIAGLRGTDAQIQRMANRYHVSYGIGKRDKSGNYEVAHSSAIFIFGPDGKARLMAKATDPASSISHDLRMLMDGA
ncbi:MAG: SCO family protein [Acidiferrobacteraceae bacterium]|jgi:protein SCO1/2